MGMSGVGEGEVGWRELWGRDLCVTPHLVVREECVGSPMVPGGRVWLVVRRKRAVVVVPRMLDGRYVLIRQERPAVRREVVEFPAGQVDEGVDGGMDWEGCLRATAIRELREETGLEVRGELRKLGEFFSSVGFTDEMQTIYLAEGVEEVEGGGGVYGEKGQEAIGGLVFLSGEELGGWVREGRIRDANTLAAYAMLAARGMI